MTTSSIALAVAVLWTISLLSLFIALSGFLLFETITAVTSIFAGIGMCALVWKLNGPAGEGPQIWKSGIGLVGGAVYAIINVLILIRFRGSDELEPWMISGLAIYGIWMILDSAFPGAGAERVSRRLEIAIGLGFLLLFVSVLSLGAIGATTQLAREPNPLMIIAQGVGGIIAYLGFPVWLFLMARRPPAGEGRA